MLLPRLAALPLLQPDLRLRAKGPLQAAAKALEAVSSPLHRLRAQLHLELARCEVADEGHVKVRTSRLWCLESSM